MDGERVFAWFLLTLAICFIATIGACTVGLWRVALTKVVIVGAVLPAWCQDHPKEVCFWGPEYEYTLEESLETALKYCSARFGYAWVEITPQEARELVQND